MDEKRWVRVSWQLAQYCRSGGGTYLGEFDKYVERVEPCRGILRLQEGDADVNATPLSHSCNRGI